MDIRRYEAADHSAVAWLHQHALENVMKYDAGPWDEDIDNIESIYLNGKGEFLVGYIGMDLVAMGAIKRTDDTRAEVKRMRVHPEHQRRGYGQLILEALEHRARELGYRSLHLDTTVQQVAAQGLYETAGYVAVRRGNVRIWYVIFYEKQLS